MISNIGNNIETNSNQKPKINCAIYTRKSTEEGLEQEFNSLHAQRLSAENYIASQQSEGWVCLENSYDDGGYSGGNMERPGLQRLLGDIREGKVDCIVVYKIDRLTRSLSDFSRLIETLDEYHVSFVSVTQSFNTSNSMGRLMLNVLLSFAQYERELTGERIRDKFDASKKKGMYMGGIPSLGYNAKDRKMVINEEEARIVKIIYSRFIETGSITTVTRDINNKYKFRTKISVLKTGKLCGGIRFDKKAIQRILQNPVYIGKIKHKDKLYDGQHEAIIDLDTWNKVQNIFSQGERPQKVGARVTTVPLLKGLISCGECGSKMLPTYTIKSRNAKRYRYYICEEKMKGRDDDCVVGRLAAGEVEEIVVGKLLELLKRPEVVVSTIGAGYNANNANSKDGDNCNNIILTDNEIIHALKDIERIWDELFPVEQARIINLLVKEVIVTKNRVEVRIFKEGLYSLVNELEGSTMTINQETSKVIDEETINIFVPMSIKKKGGKAQIILPKGAGNYEEGGTDVLSGYNDNKKNYDETLMKAFSRAYKWKTMFQEGKVDTLIEICRMENLERTYAGRLYHLNFVAPNIVEAIVEGRQPRTMCLNDFMVKPVPELWSEQMEVYGF